MNERPAASGFDGRYAGVAYRRNLPHMVQANVLYYVTFRLHDSVPQAQLHEWRPELQRWHEANPEPHTPAQREQVAELGYRRIERWLDRRSGRGVLADARCQQVIVACITKYDGERLWLGDYIIMPNHVHVILQLRDGTGLKELLKSWYGTTTHGINKALGRAGTLWQADPFDHIVRDEAALARIRRYIQGNGQGLAVGQYLYGCGRLFS